MVFLPKPSCSDLPPLFFFLDRVFNPFSLRGSRQSVQVTQAIHSGGEEPLLANHNSYHFYQYINDHCTVQKR